MKKEAKFSIKFIAYTGLMTAIVYVCTLIGVTVAGEYNFNIGDSAILITAALFNPLAAMLAGGLGAFLADLTTYPATMVYTLIIKAIEGLLAGILFKIIYAKFGDIQEPTKKQNTMKIIYATLNCLLCTLIMAGGYFLCKWLFYGTLESAIISLPKNILQAVVSTLIAMLVLYVGKLEKMRSKTYLSIVEIVKHQDLTDAVDESDDVERIVFDTDENPATCEDDSEDSNND